MGELADAGAAGFTDDGRPVVSPGLMRRALQYSPVAGRRVAVHCEEPTLTRGGQMHEGVVSAELGFAGYPSVGESVMVERDLSHRRLRAAGRCTSCTCRRASRSRRSRARRRPAWPATGEVDAAPPLPDRRGRALARLEREDEPAAALRRRPRGARRRPARRDDLPRSPPTTRRTRATRRTSRSRRRRSASPGSRRRSPRSTRTSSGRASSRSRRCSSGCRPAPARAFGLEPPRIAVGAPANLVLLDTEAAWRVTEDGFRSRSANSWLLGQTLKGRSR